MTPWSRIVNAIVTQCSHTYQLNPWWWREDGHVCRRMAGREIRKECLALIVANCYARGMHSAPRKDVQHRGHIDAYLLIGHGTVAYYRRFFFDIPQYHQRLLRTFSGQQAAEAVRKHQLPYLPPLALSTLEVDR